MSGVKRVRLFKNGHDQAVRIPVEFEMPGDTVLMHREGNRLVIEPMPKTGLLEILANLEPIEEPFPDIDEGLLPLRNIGL